MVSKASESAATHHHYAGGHANGRSEMDYVKFIYRPLAARAAHHVLVGRNRARQSADRGRFTRADVDDLLKTAWVHYRRARRATAPGADSRE